MIRIAVVEARGGTIPTEPEQTAVHTQMAEVAVTPADTPEPTVTRVALNLTSLSSVLEAETEAAAPSTPIVAPARVLEAALTDEDLVETVILPSLIAPIYEGSLAVSTTPQTVTDIRSVTGKAVNVRSGPGTSYDAVSTLFRGDEVEVLQDTGAGWVEFRSVNTGTTGWVADFLLTGG